MLGIVRVSCLLSWMLLKPEEQQERQEMHTLVQDNDAILVTKWQFVNQERVNLPASPFQHPARRPLPTRGTWTCHRYRYLRRTGGQMPDTGPQ